MTETARKVLRDCQIALKMLEAEGDIQKWNIIWAGGVALLRTVGDVLHRIDGHDENGEKNDLWVIQNRIFLSWKGDSDHIIFEEFIKHERDNLLHRYEKNVYREESIQIAVVDESHAVNDVFTIETDLFRPMTGSFAFNEDARDVFRDAVTWWEAQLDKIESELQT